MNRSKVGVPVDEPADEGIGLNEALEQRFVGTVDGAESMSVSPAGYAVMAFVATYVVGQMVGSARPYATPLAAGAAGLAYFASRPR